MGGAVVVTAHNEEGGSRVQVSLNRSSVLGLSGLLGLLSGVFVADVEPFTLGVFALSLAVGLGVTLGPWPVTHKRTRRRVDALMHTITRTMTEMGEWPETSDTGSGPSAGDEAGDGRQPEGGAS